MGTEPPKSCPCHRPGQPRSPPGLRDSPASDVPFPLLLQNKTRRLKSKSPAADGDERLVLVRGRPWGSQRVPGCSHVLGGTLALVSTNLLPGAQGEAGGDTGVFI